MSFKDDLYNLRWPLVAAFVGAVTALTGWPNKANPARTSAGLSQPAPTNAPQR